MGKEGEVAMTYLVKKENTPREWCIDTHNHTLRWMQQHNGQSDVHINSKAQSHKFKCHILEVGHKILFTADNYLYLSGSRPCGSDGLATAEGSIPFSTAAAAPRQLCHFRMRPID